MSMMTEMAAPLRMSPHLAMQATGDGSHVRGGAGSAGEYYGSYAGSQQHWMPNATAPPSPVMGVPYQTPGSDDSSADSAGPGSTYQVAPPPPPRVDSLYVPRHIPERRPASMTAQQLDRALDDLENMGEC
jgi:hypothetical protein